jgi:hypothetical protein
MLQKTSFLNWDLDGLTNRDARHAGGDAFSVSHVIVSQFMLA